MLVAEPPITATTQTHYRVGKSVPNSFTSNPVNLIPVTLDRLQGAWIGKYEDRWIPENWYSRLEQLERRAAPNTLNAFHAWRDRRLVEQAEAREQAWQGYVAWMLEFEGWAPEREVTAAKLLRYLTTNLPAYYEMYQRSTPEICEELGRLRTEQLADPAYQALVQQARDVREAIELDADIHRYAVRPIQYV